MNTKNFILSTAAIISCACIFGQSYIEEFDFSTETAEPAPSVYVPYSDIEIERESIMAAKAQGHVSEKDAVMTSSSFVNWTKNTFASDVAFNIEKAGIPLPSGKSTSVKEIEM